MHPILPVFFLQMCHIHSENRVTKLVSVPRALVQTARCVYVTRNEDDTCHVILSQMPFRNTNNHAIRYLPSLLLAC